MASKKIATPRKAMPKAPGTRGGRVPAPSQPGGRPANYVPMPFAPGSRRPGNAQAMPVGPAIPVSAGNKRPTTKPAVKVPAYPGGTIARRRTRG